MHAKSWLKTKTIFFSTSWYLELHIFLRISRAKSLKLTKWDCEMWNGKGDRSSWWGFALDLTYLPWWGFTLDKVSIKKPSRWMGPNQVCLTIFTQVGSHNGLCSLSMIIPGWTTLTLLSTVGVNDPVRSRQFKPSTSDNETYCCTLPAAHRLVRFPASLACLQEQVGWGTCCTPTSSSPDFVWSGNLTRLGCTQLVRLQTFPFRL